MKNQEPTITLLGNNSGRNLGDAAILSALMDSLSKEIPGAKFYVPSIAPKWIEKHYGNKYNVKPLNVMPWTLSLRLLGVPTMWAMAKSDAALICDGIIFGYKFFSPHNFLITLLFLAPWAKLVGCKLICHNCGIGPFPSKISRWAAKIVMNLSSIITLRETDSLELAQQLGVKTPIKTTGDAAFVNPVSSRERAIEIMKAEGISLDKPKLGVNVTVYVDAWLEKNERVGDKDAFLNSIVAGIKLANTKVKEEFEPIVFCTQPMEDEYSAQFAERIGAKIISNSKYLSHDMQAVMRECGLLMGMRFHSIVLSTAVDTPVLGLIYAPKVRGIMRFMGTPEFGLELADLNNDTLADALSKAWDGRVALWEKQEVYIKEQCKSAKQADIDLAKYLYPKLTNKNKDQQKAA
ncbi:MAG: polysaccharide pyruvyl transferase family protein [Bdellovibrionota bacterium]